MSSLHQILSIASEALPAAGIDCLLIGGFAVNYYGYTRNTLDIDFMVRASQRAQVRVIMREAGFTNIDVRENAVYFSKPDDGFRVDFLVVDQATIQTLIANASDAVVHGYSIRIPCLRDILAMKIHALTQDTARRMGKDLPDIAYLSVMNDLEIERDIQPLCDRYGTPEICRLVSDQIEALRIP